MEGSGAKGKNRIEFTIFYKGQRYRPILKRTPTEANLRRARIQLADINRRIADGNFDFAEEFPDYRYLDELQEEGEKQQKITCGQIFDRFIAHCEMRVAMNDMAFSTLDGYIKILDAIWRPEIGDDDFEEVVYSRLSAVAAAHTQKKKTYNNVVSALRCAFAFGYKDHPERHNPALGLTTLRIQKKDRPPVDPFTIQEGELIIAGSHAEFGLAHGNYEEFRFFTGLRQSEQIALTIRDCDLEAGKIYINKAIVLRRAKDRTRTGIDREIALCGRALAVLKRQLALREEMRRAGKIDHDLVFFDEEGAPIINLSYPYRRGGYVLESRKVRYREPYNARHSCVSWRLMAGHNVMLVAEEDGHSVATMLKTYAAWTKGATEVDVELIKRAMEHSPLPPSLRPSPGAPRFDGFKGIRPPQSPEFATNMPPRRGEGRLSWRKQKKKLVEAATLQNARIEPDLRKFRMRN